MFCGGLGNGTGHAQAPGYSRPFQASVWFGRATLTGAAQLDPSTVSIFDKLELDVLNVTTYHIHTKLSLFATASSLDVIHVLHLISGDVVCMRGP